MTRSYPMPVVNRARELHDAGWATPEIRRLLVTETGFGPTLETIRVWVKPAYRDRAVENVRRKNREATAAVRLARMQELQRAGLSALAISQVALVWWGERISEETVRDRLGGCARRSYRKRVVDPPRRTR